MSWTIASETFHSSRPLLLPNSKYLLLVCISHRALAYFIDPQTIAMMISFATSFQRKIRGGVGKLYLWTDWPRFPGIHCSKWNGWKAKKKKKRRKFAWHFVSGFWRSSTSVAVGSPMLPNVWNINGPMVFLPLLLPNVEESFMYIVY